MERLKECMKNSARLKELGLPDYYAPILERYAPEGDLIDDDSAKVPIPLLHIKSTYFSS